LARKYARSAGKDVERAVHREKRGKLKSGKGGKGGTVKSRKQAIAIGLSEARKEARKSPRRRRARSHSRKSAPIGSPEWWPLESCLAHPTMSAAVI
jgi:hypothetical protein